VLTKYFVDEKLTNANWNKVKLMPWIRENDELIILIREIRPPGVNEGLNRGKWIKGKNFRLISSVHCQVGISRDGPSCQNTEYSLVAN
jgi:hypothetical protein